MLFGFEHIGVDLLEHTGTSLLVQLGVVFSFLVLIRYNLRKILKPGIHEKH